MTPAPFLAPNARRKAFPLSFFLSPHVNANCKPPPSLQARVGGASSYFCCWCLSRVSLVGVFPPTQDGRGVPFLPQPHSHFKCEVVGFLCRGFCAATLPFPLCVANATSAPPSSTPGRGVSLVQGTFRFTRSMSLPHSPQARVAGFFVCGAQRSQIGPLTPKRERRGFISGVLY